MRKILSVLSILFLMTSNSWATVGWNKAIPATSENPQAISPDVIENNTALDLMLQDYRSGHVSISLISTSEIDVGPGGVMLSNVGGSVRLMVANAALTAVSSTMIDTGTISASSTYYLYAYASSTTATTFSVIFSASATSPTGITYYARLGSFTTDGSKNFISVTNDIFPFPPIVGTTLGSGTYGSSNGPTTTAISASGYATNCTGNDHIICYMGSASATANVITQGGSYTGGNVDANCSMVVPKGWYWEITDNCQDQNGHALSTVTFGN